MIKFKTLSELYTAIEDAPERQKFDLSDNVVRHSIDSNGNWYPGAVMIIGEAPGESEDEQGVPFVGRSGKLLRTMLDESGLFDHCIYITNFCKQRPPNNRNPYISELSFYLPYVLQEIELVDPALIITTGQIPYSALTGDIEKISLVRGNVTHIGDTKKYNIWPIFHPAYCKQYAKAKFRTEMDLINARKFIEQA